MPRSLEDQIRGKCVHFTGTMNKCCDAGIEYDSIRADGKGFPCLRGKPFNGEELGCEKREWPTDEQVKDRIDEIEESSARMFAGLAVVAEDAKAKGFGKGNGGTGSVACPVCDGGTIRYSVAGYNGHRHARCSTDGCVAFME